MFGCCKGPGPRDAPASPAPPNYDKPLPTAADQAAATAAAAGAGISSLAHKAAVGVGMAKDGPPSRMDEVKRNRLPNTAIFPAASPYGLAVLKALTTWPMRSQCGRITCVVKDEAAITKIRKYLGDNVTDSLTYTFATFTDDQEMTKAFVGIDRLLLAPHHDEKRGELGVRACEAAKAAGVGHLVLISFLKSEVADSDANLFSKQFSEIEANLKATASTMPYTFLRSPYSMENLLVQKDDMIKDGCFYASWGGSRFGIVALEDIGRCGASIIASPVGDTFHHNKIMNVTGPELLTGQKMATIFSEVLGKKIEYRDIPPEDLKEKLIAKGLPEWEAQGQIEVDECHRVGQSAVCTPDVATITKGNHTSFADWVLSIKPLFEGKTAPLVAVFPGTGKVGTATVKSLQKDSAGCHVRIICRSEEKKKQLEEEYKDDPRFSVVVADMNKPETVGPALATVDRLILIPPQQVETFSNVENVIKSAKEANVPLVVMASMTENFSTTAMGKKFGAWERTLKEVSNAWAIVRTTVMMQVLNRMVDDADKTKIHHWLENGRWCPVHSGDIGSALGAVAREGPFTHKGVSHDLTGPDSLTIAEIVAKMPPIVGHPVTAVPDVTMEQYRAKIKPLFATHIVEEIVQVMQVLQHTDDQEPSQTIFSLVGKGKKVEEYLEENKELFT